MQPVELILSARQIVPIEPIDVIHDDASIVVNNGRIIDLLPTKQALQQYSAHRQFDFDQHIIMPGLINTHTHAAMTLMRGIASDLPLMEWLENHIWPVEQQWVDESFVHDGSELAIAEMLRSGTTCFNDMYFFPEVTARVASSIGIRAVLGMIMLEFPTRYASSTQEYFSKGLALHDTHKSDPLINTVFAPHAPYTVHDATLTKLNSYADELDLPIHMHVHETAGEIETSLKEYGMRPLARLDQLGLVNPNLLAVHMTQLQNEEIEHIAEAGVNVIHCPESNLKLASGHCPSTKLLQHGINLSIGTDGCASNDDLDMFGELKTAALLAKGISQDATAMPAQQALRAATINAAKALRLDHEIGSIEINKSADVIAIRCDDIESLPIYDTFSQLVYSMERSRVTDVFVAGRQLLHDRTLTSISEEEILAKTKSWSKKLKGHDQ